MNLTEPSVELVGVVATLAKVGVEDERGDDLQACHEVLWRVRAEPVHVLCQEIVQVIGEVAVLIVGADAGGKKGNYRKLGKFSNNSILT